jgi:hypothetical protein
MGFPQLGNIDKRIVDTIKAKAGNNLRASKVMPWIRVISCLGDFLAMESSPANESFSQRYGDTGKSGRLGVDKNGNSVYGNAGDRGLRPSPTIDSISISQGNEGLSKKSSFTIICYSLGQCEKIMEYFLEPGNMVLVEWGENNNKSTGQKTNVETCAIAAYNSLKVVQEKRKLAHGMYDAVLGVITGGGMSYGSNETFEVQVELTSIGELPAYLQHHKGIMGKTRKNDTSNKYKSFQISGETDIGKRLFKQMYNDLPAIKRTDAIKDKLENAFFTDSINFINMDKQIREDLGGGIKDAKVMTKGGKVKITSDLPLFSEKRFIRVALAFSIIDLMDKVTLKPTPKLCGGTNPAPSNGNVMWYNTICRAHKNMFSADSNYLYIPNRQAPSFDLLGALRSEAPDGTTTAFENPLPNLEGSEISSTTDIHPPSHGGTKTSYFPCNQPLNFEDQACYDGAYVPVTAESGEWGFLRDLYINFDFFCDTIEKSGLVTKDIYYELLNGMSSAVNLYWNFQIIPRGSINIYTPGGELDADTYYKNVIAEGKTIEGCEELQIVDASFGGKSVGASVGLAKFQSRGALTPFLSAELNFDIPGAMKGQVIGSKLAGKKRTGIENPNSEDKEIRLDGLFTGKIDSVLKELNAVQEATSEANKAEAKSSTQETAGEKKDRLKKEKKDEKAAEVEQKKANYEYFVENACVVPSTQDRDANMDFVKGFWDMYSGNDVNIESLAVVGSWNDSAVLKKVQMLNEGLLAGGDAKTSKLNVPLLPIKFNFTIHGVSGIRVGDTFSIIDLPGKYNTKVFQVTQVAHDIAQNLWSTKIEGSMRNMEAGTAKLKEYK